MQLLPSSSEELPVNQGKAIPLRRQIFPPPHYTKGCLYRGAMSSKGPGLAEPLNLERMTFMRCERGTHHTPCAG